MRVRVEATKRRWRITTSTGWTQGWWAITESGMRRAVCGVLTACGLPVTAEGAQTIVDLAREHGYVEVGEP